MRLFDGQRAWVVQRISALLFKRVFFIGMALLGIHLLINN